MLGADLLGAQTSIAGSQLEHLEAWMLQHMRSQRAGKKPRTAPAQKRAGSWARKGAVE